jgi:hypothetical protein
MHLHMMCLGVITNLLEEDDKEQCNADGTTGDDNNDVNDWQGNGSKLFGVGGGGRDNKEGWQRRVEEVYRWARYTFLSHLRNCLHLDRPFQYMRLMPFGVAMGLSMALFVPPMRTLALNAFRDLVLEEETLCTMRPSGQSHHKGDHRVGLLSFGCISNRNSTSSSSALRIVTTIGRFLLCFVFRVIPPQ